MSPERATLNQAGDFNPCGKRAKRITVINMDKETLLRKVKNVLEQVRPYLQQDGGDVNFVELTDDNTVIVELTGACGNCPHSKMTLKNGIESVMKKVIPEIKAVEQSETLEL